MKKKSIAIILVLLNFVAIISGCQNSTTEPITLPNGSPALLSHFPIESIKETNIFSETMNPSYSTYYDSLGSLAADCDAVIYGKITDIEYMTMPLGQQQSHLYVDVMKSFKGPFQPGDNIDVYEIQGISTFENYISTFSSKEEELDIIREQYIKDYGFSSRDDLKTHYIETHLLNDKLVKTGEKYVYFLTKALYFEENHGYVHPFGPLTKFIDIGDKHFISVNDYSMLNEDGLFIMDDIHYNGVMSSYTFDDFQAIANYTGSTTQ